MMLAVSNSVTLPNALIKDAFGDRIRTGTTHLTTAESQPAPGGEMQETPDGIDKCSTRLLSCLYFRGTAYEITYLALLLVLRLTGFDRSLPRM